MHAKASLFFNMISCFSIWSLQFQIVSNTVREVTIYRFLFLLFFSAVPNRFKYRQNAPFSVLVFKVFNAMPNHFKCRQNAPFTVPACFQNYLCNSKLFQIPSESTIYCHCFQNLQEATLVLMLPSCICTTYVLFFLLKFQISFKKVSKGKL